MINKIKK